MLTRLYEVKNNLEAAGFVSGLIDIKENNALILHVSDPIYLSTKFDFVLSMYPDVDFSWDQDTDEETLIISSR